MINSVTYEHPDGLSAAYDEIAAAYEAVGAHWTVWVRPRDSDATALLAERGHVLDAEPEAMARTLEGSARAPGARGRLDRPRQHGRRGRAQRPRLRP